MIDLAGDLSNDPAARRVRKRPVLRTARFADRAGSCATMEGPVPYRAGDAIVTGEQGERWPVAREQFLASYAALAPAVAGQDGSYVARPQDVLARRLDGPARIAINPAGDMLEGRRGDWLVQYADGSRAIVAEAIFAATYEPAPA